MESLVKAVKLTCWLYNETGFKDTNKQQDNNSRKKSSWSTNKMNYGVTAEIDNENPWTVTSQTSPAVSK